MRQLGYRRNPVLSIDQQTFQESFGISSDTGPIIDPYRGGPWTPACVIELNLLHRTSVPFDGSWRSGTRADYTNEVFEIRRY